jgi:hypothetical protein
MVGYIFSKAQEKEILSLARLYKREAKKCFDAKAYLAGCILIGAAMESILLSAANLFPEIITSAKCAPKRKGVVKRLDSWTFNELLMAAKELNWLPSGLSSKGEWDNAHANIGDYVDVVRQIRNLIHPVRYLNDFSRKRVTKKYLEACFEIVDTAADHLYLIVSSSLKLMLEEKARRMRPTKRAADGG